MDLTMKLGRWTLADFTHTDTGLPNLPDDEATLSRLQQLADVLTRIEAKLGVKLHLNSVYRSHAVNVAVHGSETSAHSLGYAADTVPGNMSLLDYFHALRSDTELMAHVDQLIAEEKPVQRGGFVRWVHVGIGRLVNDVTTLSARREVLAWTPKTRGRYLPFAESLLV